MKVGTFLRLAGGLGLVGTGILWIGDKLLIVEAGGRIVGEFRDKILEPEIGSIVFCVYRGFQHTGIYVGNGLIVSLKKNGKNAVVTKEHAADFIKGKGAENIYVFCNGEEPVGNKEVAERAMKKIGKVTRYKLTKNNCHHFCAECLTGRFDESAILFEHLEEIAKSELDCNIKFRIWDKRLWYPAGRAPRRPSPA